MRVHPDWCQCRRCLKEDELEQRAALAEASRGDDDPSVEAELSSPPVPVPTDLEEFAEWAKTKLDPYEQAGQ